jgi:serine/threonine-protein kinase
LQLSPASVQSDIYAVGVTLWESLCAKRLFRADTEIGLWGLVLAGNIARPSTFIGPIGPLEDVIMRSLAKDRAERYPNALEMAQAIEACTRLASPTEIAAWVRKRAADSLAERSSAVQVIDSMRPRATADSSSRNVARHDSIATAASGTASTVSTEVLTGTATGSRPWLMRTVVALLAFAIVALVALRGLDARRNRTGGTTPELGTSPVVGVVSASLSAPSAGVPPVLAASVASASVPAATRATEPPASAEVAATPALDSTGAKRRPPRPVAPAAPATSFVRPVQDPCDPPFSLDAQGRKHFKLNCVN